MRVILAKLAPISQGGIDIEGKSESNFEFEKQ
jgi:hypothetical protein